MIGTLAKLGSTLVALTHLKHGAVESNPLMSGVMRGSIEVTTHVKPKKIVKKVKKTAKKVVRNINLDNALDKAQKIAEVTGHGEIATVIDFLDQYNKRREDGGSNEIESLLQDLVDPNLGPKQVASLQNWDKQIDRILNVAIVWPEATEEIDRELEKLTKGKIDIQTLD